MSIRIRLALIACLSLCSGEAEVGPRGPFHAPTTPPERALDATLGQTDRDRDPVSDLSRFRRRALNLSSYTNFAFWLSPGLLEAIDRAEKAQVELNCGGRYLHGELCGLGYNPLTCAQDSTSGYLYRTELTTADQAVISYRWPKNPKPVATYRLIRRTDRWLVDGVRCEGQSFHWQTPSG